MVRLLEAAQSLSGTAEIEFCNHRRRAKKRARAIIYTRGKDKKATLYRDLIKITMLTLGYLERAKMILAVTGSATLQLEAWHAEVAHYLPLIRQVTAVRRCMDVRCGDGTVNAYLFSLLHAERQINQIHRRMIHGEVIPHGEKVFSLFEEHTECIVKGKAGVPVELGLRVCVLVDHMGFILHHKVMQQQTDDKITVDMVRAAQVRYRSLATGLQFR